MAPDIFGLYPIWEMRRLQRGAMECVQVARSSRDRQNALSGAKFYGGLYVVVTLQGAVVDVFSGRDVPGRRRLRRRTCEFHPATAGTISKPVADAKSITDAEPIADAEPNTDSRTARAIG